MTKHVSIRGAAPVGHFGDLDPLEAAAVLCLRLWLDGPDTQKDVWNDLVGTLGAASGRETLRALEEVCGICARHGRRSLMRHQPRCKCRGADEACIANLVSCATDGDREDAMLIATLMLRPDFAPHLAAAAQVFGLGLKRMALCQGSQAAFDPPRTLH